MQPLRLDPATDAPLGPAARLPLVDAARGVAIIAMVIYHFSWDLRYFGYITTDVGAELGWRIFARLIAGTFIFLVGVSLVLATRNGLNRRRYLIRLAMVAGGAAAITIATHVAFPDAFIFFGILHNIAMASVLGLAFVRASLALVIVAAGLCFVVPTYLSSPLFDHPALVWLGLSTYEPRSNDFVPLFPWFGVALAGIVVARLAPALAARGAGSTVTRYARLAPRQLLWLGRNSLLIYLLHQPILFGLVYGAAQVAPPDFLGFEPAFIESCSRSCADAEIGAEYCRPTCECLAARSQEEGLWADLMRESLSDEQTTRYFALADACRVEAGG